jgi:hypothetical protein
MKQYAYVAGRFGDWRLVRDAQNTLRSRDYAITFDWTPIAEEVELAEGDQTHRMDDGVELNTLRNNATLDLNGVCDADLYVLVCNPNSMENAMGCYIELGAALACGLECHVINPPRDSVFFHRPRVLVFSDVIDWAIHVNNNVRIG